MRKSKFKDPKTVLVFSGARVLIAIVRSLHSASVFSGGNPQAISFCCSGKYIGTGGFYFRHVHPDIEIDLSDLDTLKLEDYDKMCGENRRYHTVRDMAKMRNRLDKKRKKQNNNDEKNTDETEM